jgi:hypothetical protein
MDDPRWTQSANDDIASLQRREQSIADAVTLAARFSKRLMLLAVVLEVPGLALVCWSVFAGGERTDIWMWLVFGGIAAMALSLFVGPKAVAHSCAAGAAAARALGPPHP